MKRPTRRRAKPAVLSAVLDLKEAGPLAASLLAQRGAPLVLDAAGVERLGGQCLQVLLAARKTWEADGQPFQFAARSAAFTEALAAFGALGLVDQHLTEARA